MSINDEFEKWALGFSGCDGGDIGSPSNQSIWVCGIEWGGGHTPEELLNHIKSNVELPPLGYEEWTHNLDYIFNWQTMKLLAAIDGNNVDEYKDFAKNKRPFTNGSTGYFKMNLYPIGFKNTNPLEWDGYFSKITGFNSKEEYTAWCNEHRLKEIRVWAKSYKPKVVICLGKTYLPKFKAAFFDGDVELTHEIIDHADLFWGTNEENTLVLILPFMVNRNGLTKNSSIQLFGQRIREITSSLSSVDPSPSVSAD